ncbi:unnamed protein product [Closterium sp. NIES-65]|nr:unnamed protein product [Closterium sp. NIES-65]
MLIELLPSSAQRTLCPAGSGCGDGECELLHVDPTWRDVLASRHVAHGDGSSNGRAWGRPRLIVCAGPERSGSTCPFNPSSHFPSSTQSLVLPSPPCPTAGSTWLFNAVRLLLAHSGQLALSYWLHSISASKLRARGLSPLCTRGPGGAGGGEGGPTEGAARSAEETGERGNGEGMGMDGGEWGGVSVVVKTHEWAEGWEVGEWSGVVLLTERDVCGVADSYLRVGWLPHSMPRIKAHMQAYLRDHQRWKQHAAAVIPLASIVPPGSPSELLCLSRLAALLGLITMEGKAEGTAEGAADGKGEGSGLEASLGSVGGGRAGGRAVDVRGVSRALAQLPVPTGWAPDPVTKLWPRHKGAAHASKGGAARGLTGEERAELQQFEESLAPAASESTEQCA